MAADKIVTSIFGVDPPQFYRVPMSYNKIDPIKDSLAEAGFADLRIFVPAREKSVPDMGSFARALIYGNPLIDMIRTRGGGDPDRVVNALEQVLIREFGNPGQIPLEIIAFEATRPAWPIGEAGTQAGSTLVAHSLCLPRLIAPPTNGHLGSKFILPSRICPANDWVGWRAAIRNLRPGTAVECRIIRTFVVDEIVEVQSTTH